MSSLHIINTILKVKLLKGLMKDAAIVELTLYAADELRYTELIADQIIPRGGIPIINQKDWFDKSVCGYKVPTEPDVLKILKDAILRWTVCHKYLWSTRNMR